ncbi:MAG: hypothetical protein H6718_12205 [Polyangiaceae bacterium]|nr:hypothetical protein [Polyangiaceae bacterium]
MSEQDLAAGFAASVDGLDHRVRVARCVELGREARSDSRAATLVAQLAASPSSYLRSLALASSYGSASSEQVLAAVRGPSQVLRKRALKLAVHVCDDEGLSVCLDHAPAGARKTLLLKLRRHGRTAAVDSWLHGVWSAQDPDQQRLDLLGYASPELVSELLASSDTAATLNRLTPHGWGRLARFHGALVASLLNQALDEAKGGIDPRLRWRLTAVLPELAAHAGEQAIALVGRLMTFEQAPGYWLGSSIQQLAKRFPEAMFDELKRLHIATRPVPAPGAFGAVRFTNLAARLGSERLCYLLLHAPTTLSDDPKRGKRWYLSLPQEQREQVLSTWLKGMASAGVQRSWGGFLFRYLEPTHPQRDEAFRRWSAAARDTHGVISIAQVAHLPPDLQQREATRHLTAVDYLQTRPRERIQYARFLAPDAAKQIVAPWLGHPEGEERGYALRALIAAAEFNPGATRLALDLVSARRFEQDPVRGVMLASLADLPRRCFGAEHLGQLGEIVDHALDAADLSTGTSFHLDRLLTSLFRLDAPWAAQNLSRLLKIRGNISSLGLLVGVARDDLAALEPAICDLMGTWATQERAGALAWLALSAGPRLGEMPSVLEAMRALARSVPLLGVVTTLLAQVRRADPKAFSELADELLAKDESFIAAPSIADFVATQRQSRLRGFLGERPLHGRFSSEQTRWVIHFRLGHGSWTARDQCTRAESLEAILADTERDVPTLRSCLDQLTRLAFAPSQLLIRFASDPRAPLREMAVRALPHLDDGSGLATLQECLGDDRARWAIYAWRKQLLALPRSEVIEMLKSVPLKQVTVAKEVIRLLGDYAGEPGLQLLLSYDRSSLHRDVHLALLRALWPHLDREEAWQVWEEASDSSDWVLASRLAEIPTARLSAESEARITRLFSKLLQRPELDARLALLGRVAYIPLVDAERVLWNACAAGLRAEQAAEAVAAFNACMHRMQGRESEQLARALLQLTEVTAKRHILAALLEVLPNHLGPYAGKARTDVGKQVLTGLIADPLLAPQAIRLAGRLYDFRRLSELLTSLSDQNLLHYDSMEAALSAVRHAVHPSQIEGLLSNAEDPRLRRIALEALLATSKPKRGWGKEQRERLAVYQADQDPLVASRAAWVVPR